MSICEKKHNWRWEEMTSLEFSDAVRACGGVCIIPFGCLERHGDHLPLGTDTFLARELVKRAVANEPAVIFSAESMMGKIQQDYFRKSESLFNR